MHGPSLAACVERKSAAVKDGGGLGLLESGECLSAPQDGLHAGGELAHAERFDEVIVGTEFETEKLVDFIIAGCQHDDRDLRDLAQAAAGLHAVETRHHEVEDDDGGMMQSGCFECIDAIGSFVCLPVQLFQEIDEQAAEARIIIDNQSTAHSRIIWWILSGIQLHAIHPFTRCMVQIAEKPCWLGRAVLLEKGSLHLHAVMVLHALVHMIHMIHVGHVLHLLHRRLPAGEGRIDHAEDHRDVADDEETDEQQDMVPLALGRRPAEEAEFLQRNRAERQDAGEVGDDGELVNPATEGNARENVQDEA